MRRRAFVLSMALALGAAGCESTGPTEPEDVDFAAELGIDLAQMTKTPSGAYYQITVAGTGAGIAPTTEFVADYKGWLADGEQFAAGRLQRDGTGGMTLNRLIDGMREGALGMKVGEVRKIVVPSRLGYGSEGAPGIPPNSVLVFEIGLVSIGG